MTWELVWTGPALKDIDGLDANHARRVHAALARLAHTRSRRTGFPTHAGLLGHTTADLCLGLPSVHLELLQLRM